ncbi:MAG: TrmH family RNA methyltransferase [Myxococcota bacterium]
MTDVLARRLVTVHCVVEALHHRHNVSAILRTCDALGLHHVHLVAGRRFKVSQGTARGAERWLHLHRHRTAEAAIQSLRSDGLRIYVADLADDAVTPEALPIDGPLALWFGAELVGVSDEARAAADGVVTLPMHGFAQSLNVSVAAALALRPVAERVRAAGTGGMPAPRQAALLEAWLARDDVLRQGIQHRGAPPTEG